jgi:hypothetical protein
MLRRPRQLDYTVGKTYTFSEGREETVDFIHVATLHRHGQHRHRLQRSGVHEGDLDGWCRMGKGKMILLSDQKDGKQRMVFLDDEDDGGLSSKVRLNAPYIRDENNARNSVRPSAVLFQAFDISESKEGKPFNETFVVNFDNGAEAANKFVDIIAGREIAAFPQPPQSKATILSVTDALSKHNITSHNKFAADKGGKTISLGSTTFESKQPGTASTLKFGSDAENKASPFGSLSKSAEDKTAPKDSTTAPAFSFGTKPADKSGSNGALFAGAGKLSLGSTTLGGKQPGTASTFKFGSEAEDKPSPFGSVSKSAEDKAAPGDSTTASVFSFGTKPAAKDNKAPADKSGSNGALFAGAGKLSLGSTTLGGKQPGTASTFKFGSEVEDKASPFGSASKSAEDKAATGDSTTASAFSFGTKPAAKDNKAPADKSGSNGDFIPAQSFAGQKPGMVFKHGAKGSGYYPDVPPKAAPASALPPSNVSSPPTYTGPYKVSATATLEERLTAFYKEVAPDKVTKVKALAEKYKTRAEVLYGKLLKQYPEKWPPYSKPVESKPATGGFSAFGADAGKKTTGGFDSTASTAGFKSTAGGLGSGASGSGFGTSAAKNTTGSVGSGASGEGNSGTGGFGSGASGGGFGARAAKNTTGSFGSGASGGGFGAGAAKNTTGSSGSGAGSGGFGFGASGAGAGKSATGGFGSGASSGGFGASAAKNTTGSFGSGASGGGFGTSAAKNTTGSFGSGASGGGFGTSAAKNTTGIFGSAASGGGFGAGASKSSTGGSFGTPVKNDPLAKPPSASFKGAGGSAFGAKSSFAFGGGAGGGGFGSTSSFGNPSAPKPVNTNGFAGFGSGSGSGGGFASLAAKSGGATGFGTLGGSSTGGKSSALSGLGSSFTQMRA